MATAKRRSDRPKVDTDSRSVKGRYKNDLPMDIHRQRTGGLDAPYGTGRANNTYLNEIDKDSNK